MTQTIQFEGATHEFPDDFTPQDIQYALAAAHPLPPSPSQMMAHDSSLAGRMAVEAVPSAVLGLPALGMDAYDSLVNGVRMGYNAIPGTNKLPLNEAFRHAKDLGNMGSMAADALSLDKPQNKVEQGILNVGTAGLSGVGGAGTFNSMAKTLEDIPRLSSIFKDLGSTPWWQSAGAAGGAAASTVARNSGASQNVVLGAGLLGSLAPGGAATLGERSLLGAKSAAVDPFTQSGREMIAGGVLNKLATNPTLAAQRLDASTPIIPGSNPTISQVSQDPGLIAAERPMIDAAGGGGQLSQRLSAQNSARQAALDKISMPSVPVSEGGIPQPGTLEYAQAKRDAAVGQNMKPAFANAKAGQEAYDAQPQLQGNYGPGFADTKPVLSKIDYILGSTKGARKDVQDAMSFARDRLQQPNVDLTDPETLYSVRKDLQNARDGKYNSDKSNLALAKGELANVISSLDGAIDQAAPGYRKYMDLYAKRSIPLNQQAAITDLRNRGQLAASDPISGDPILSIGKFGGAVRKALASGSLGRGVGNANLSDQQIKVLADVTADLDRGAASTAATIKPPGSDTFRNFTVANLLGRVIGKNFPDTATGRGLQTLAKPVQWMYSLPDEAINNLLVDAALNPKLAARMITTANKAEMENIATELAKRSAQQELGNVAHNSD